MLNLACKCVRPPANREIAMKMLASILGTAMILSPPLHAQFTGPKVADARPGDVRVIATAAIREPLNAVLKQAEATVDKPIVAEYGSARGNLKDQILKGQDFEVAMLLPDVDDEIQAAGKIVPGRFEIALPCATAVTDVPAAPPSNWMMVASTQCLANSPSAFAT